jgi:PAS domain S-box-containing protein
VEDEELNEAQALAGILDTAIDAIITIDETGRMTRVNRATTKLFGYDESELVGNNVSMLIPGRTAQEHDGYLERYLRTGEARIIGIGRNVDARRKDGSTFPAHLSVGESRLGESVFFTGILRDLTDTRQREAEATRLGRIFEDSLNEIFVFDEETLRFKLVNRGARENLGYSGAELQTLTPVDIKPDFDEEQFRRLIQPLREGRQEQLTFETVHRRKDGSEYGVEVHLHHAPIEGEFVAVILDISERRALQSQVVEAQRMEAVGQLAGGVAHDFNNLLTSIRGSAELIAGRLDPEDPSQRALRRIGQAAERGSSLTQQLLAFGRRHVTQPEALDLNSAVAQIVDLTARVIGEDIETEMQLHPDPLPIMADPTLLDQVAMNLIVNAGDAMPSGGKLSIATESLTISQTDASRLEMVPGPAARLSVADTGEGMSPEVLSRAFEPFFTTKEIGKGTGLGLSTVHGIVKQSGWGVNVTTRLGEGTRFDVVLPLASAKPKKAARSEPMASSHNRMTVLLVEDDPLVRELALEVLEGAGHEVWVAETPEAALELATSRIIELDVLLSDVVMPSMTGIELARRLRGARPDLPVMLISGYPRAALESRGAAESGFPLLPKPFSNEELLGELHKIVNR